MGFPFKIKTRTQAHTKKKRGTCGFLASTAVRAPGRSRRRNYFLDAARRERVRHRHQCRRGGVACASRSRQRGQGGYVSATRMGVTGRGSVRWPTSGASPGGRCSRRGPSGSRGGCCSHRARRRRQGTAAAAARRCRRGAGTRRCSSARHRRATPTARRRTRRSRARPRRARRSSRTSRRTRRRGHTHTASATRFASPPSPPVFCAARAPSRSRARALR